MCGSMWEEQIEVMSRMSLLFGVKGGNFPSLVMFMEIALAFPSRNKSWGFCILHHLATRMGTYSLGPDSQKVPWTNGSSI